MEKAKIQKLPKIPKKLKLPFGFSITVRYVPETELAPHQSDYESIEDGGVIRLNKHTDLARQMDDFKHEMGHGFVDWAGHVEHVIGDFVSSSSNSEGEATTNVS